MLSDISLIKKAGFSGFKSVKELWSNCSCIPNEKGIYVIINPDHPDKSFLVKGSGGFFKGKDPNVHFNELSVKWVDSSPVIYIGKAGGDSSSATLQKRLKQYMDFGMGKPIGHYGGRYIWQLANHSNLLVAWKATPSADPRIEEELLIREFYKFHGKLPFANLKF